MSIYCPLSEALGIKTTISILDIPHVTHHQYDESGRPLPAWNKGFKMGPESEETRRKKSFAQIGNKNAAGNKDKPKLTKHKNKISRSNCKTKWKVLYPTGRVFNITNMNRFCKKNNLSQSAMSEVLSGKRPHHKGFKRG